MFVLTSDEEHARQEPKELTRLTNLNIIVPWTVTRVNRSTVFGPTMGLDIDKTERLKLPGCVCVIDHHEHTAEIAMTCGHEGEPRQDKNCHVELPPSEELASTSENAVSGAQDRNAQSGDKR